MTFDAAMDVMLDVAKRKVSPRAIVFLWNKKLYGAESVKGKITSIGCVGMKGFFTLEDVDGHGTCIIPLKEIVYIAHEVD